MAASILIVDDESSIRKLFSRFLTEAGHECHQADGAEAARRILAEKHFDLLLSDLNMPGESGLALIRFAKENYPDTGRLMITGHGSPELSNEVIQVGVYGYIIKPVAKNELLITVENALAHLLLDRHMQASQRVLEKEISGQTEKASAIMNNLNVGVAMFDKHMAVVDFNRKLHQWFPEICPGKTIPCRATGNCSDDNSQCVDCAILSTFRTGSIGETKSQMMTAQGEKDFRVVTSPVFDKQGNVYAGVALYEDITEKNLLERDLQQAQKLEAVGQLAAGIAHELNSPIQYIGDNISFLRDSLKDYGRLLDTYQNFWQELAAAGSIPEKMLAEVTATRDSTDIKYLTEEIPKTIEQSLEGVHRVKKIVRAMKDFSHPGDEEKTLASINAILQNTATICRNEWKYVAELVTDLAEDLPLVPCFASEIGQVFLNIIVNGAHAIGETLEGGSKTMGTITIHSHLAGDRVQVRIQDSGEGIPEEVQQRIFEPFFTTKQRGKGTGQGLAIARRIVESKHQGQISFETEKGRGTTFVIELPLQ